MDTRIERLALLLKEYINDNGDWDDAIEEFVHDSNQALLKIDAKMEFMDKSNPDPIVAISTIKAFKNAIFDRALKALPKLSNE